MPDIVLTTANARSSHTSFGLRYLFANMGELQERCVMREFTINDQANAIAEDLLAMSPQIIGFGVYIWNVSLLTDVVRILKAVEPEITVIIGGPEVSYEQADMPIVQLADVTITGEADLEFPKLCAKVLNGTQFPSLIDGGAPTLDQIQSPYEYYDADDVHHRLVYVEASRGCPFLCSFCLSSLDIPVRAFPMEAFLADMEILLERGCKIFKFVDRTFNLKLRDSLRILDFFLKKIATGAFHDIFLHFELIPDRLPADIRQRLRKFPKGSIQFEIGIQSFTPEVCKAIDRRMDVKATKENLNFLTQETHVHVHADLIAGLPGETNDSFAASFDELWRLSPHDIQLGILKKLRGTKIATPDMVFNVEPPYEIICNESMSFQELQRIKRLARFLEIFVNSERFPTTIAYLMENESDSSPFDLLMGFTEWIWSSYRIEHGISLGRQYDFLYTYLTSELARPHDLTVEKIRTDFEASGNRKGMPDFLRPEPSSSQ